MRCPFCRHAKTDVKDSRPTEDDSAIRRRRVCQHCKGRFTTFERVQLREISVLKGDGKREPYDQDKLRDAMLAALKKRPVPPAKIDNEVARITRRLEQSGEAEIPSLLIAEMMLDSLAALDGVAYVRAASMHKNFTMPRDFETFVRGLFTKT